MKMESTLDNKGKLDKGYVFGGYCKKQLCIRWFFAPWSRFLDIFYRETWEVRLCSNQALEMASFLLYAYAGTDV